MIKLDQPELRIDKYRLRPLNPNDIDKVFVMKSDEAILEHLDGPKITTKQEARDFIEKIQNGVKHKDWYFWAISLTEHPSAIGTICLWNLNDKESKADVGFVLLPEHQGKGVMQSILPKLLQFGFEDLKLAAIEAEVAPKNIKSIQLMKNHGFQFLCHEGETDIYVLPASSELTE